MTGTVIVTGAAKGIGQSIAQRMMEDGWYVVAVDMDPSVWGMESARCRPVLCDISDPRSVDALFASLAQGRVEAFVNNAGIIRDNLIWNMPPEDFDSVTGVNLKGTWLMCRGAAAVMKSQRSGRVVNITSRAWLGNPGQTNYSASKAGVVGLTRALALELGRYGVLVNAVAPGLIDTPLAAALSADVREKLIMAQPTREMGRPEDVAHLVAFLCDLRTCFITGQTIYVDGGKSIGAGI